MKGICEALPFEIVGSTTLGNGVGDSTGNILLTLLVLTSDDVEFAIGLTDSIVSEDKTPLWEAYKIAAGKLSGAPKLMFSFAPLLLNVGGDFYVETFNAISNGLPNFGMISVDHNSDYHDSKIIYNGEAYKDKYAFILISGEIHPHFFTASIRSEKIFEEKGIVTASVGNQLQTVNGKPVVEFLQKLGLRKDENDAIIGINSFPFIVDYNDGTKPVVRVMFANTPEGYAVCGGDIPVGATISVGSIDANEILQTTSDVLKEALDKKPDDTSCFLIFSCVGRYFGLGFEPMAEIEASQKAFLGTGIPFQITYSGGEICPVYSKNEDLITTNRNHNDTFCICIF
jgi:hypothetical protein